MLKSFFGIKVEHVDELDWTLDGAGVSSVEVRTASGSISLRGVDQGHIIVHARKTVRGPTREQAEAFAREVQVHARRENGQVRVYAEHARPPMGTSVSVRYAISSPPGVDADLHTKSGPISAKEIEGQVHAETHSGSIEVLGGARAAKLHARSGSICARGVVGPVRAETSSGSIEVDGGSGVADLHTGSGGIQARLERIEETARFASRSGSIHVEIGTSTAPVTIKGSSGKIVLKIDAGIVPVTAETSSGSIHVTVPAGYAGQLDAGTRSGSIHNDLPLSASRSSRERVTGQIGEGGSTTLRLHTSSGSVHIGAQ
jgi:putative adhesin